jgi:hypothetical protein
MLLQFVALNDRDIIVVLTSQTKNSNLSISAKKISQIKTG